MIVKDAMVVIHLAKITLLEKSCETFKPVIIPEEVLREIIEGEKRGYEDVAIIRELIRAEKMSVRRVRDKKLLKRAKEFNIQRGEAETVALYWQEKAERVASDDDNLRKKSVLLNLHIIGTPAIILKLYQDKLIDRHKLLESLRTLRKIGWFSNAVIDRIAMEVQ
jgi:predicted nucleic acid-binding protein